MISRAIYIIFAALLMLCSCGTEDYVAVVGQIEGTVLNSDTREPIDGCEVISNSSGTSLTDANGHFSFSNVEPGPISLTYKAAGFETITREITVTAGSKVSADVSLKPIAITNNIYPDKSVLDFGKTTGVLNLILKNPTGNSISYSIQSDASWISADPDHGTVLSQRESTVRVSVNRDEISDGSYERKLTVETAQGPIEILVQVDKGTITRPTVNTISVSQSADNPTTITAKGAIAIVGSSKISQHGFCYAIGTDPTLEKNDGYTKLGDINYPANFDGVLTNMEYEKEYFIRAYATNDAGTGYGETKIITLHKVEYASLATGSASNITSTSVTLSATISGGTAASFSRLGFMYGTTPECKSQSANAVASGSSYSVGLNGLSPDTEYFYKAYGEDSRGLQYGEVKSFRTSKGSSSQATFSMVTSQATNVSETSATLNGALTSNGDVKLKECGFFYGTSPNPTLRKVVSSYSTPVNAGSFSFKFDLTGLKETTKYYFQSYAIDDKGILYKGSEQSFTTTTPASIKINSITVSATYGDRMILIYHIKGSATIEANGNTIIEAGFISNDFQVPEFSNNMNPYTSVFNCEIKGNTISVDTTREYGTGVDGFTTHNQKAYFRAYIILANGTIIYSDVLQVTHNNPLN